jgi:hypothetical protein
VAIDTIDEGKHRQVPAGDEVVASACL